jgi:hypothetical protein
MAKKPTGRVVYGKEKSKSKKAIKGWNHFVEIQHPSGAVDKNERIDFYVTSGSALRGARRAGVRLNYPVVKAEEIKEVKNAK